MKKSLKAMAAEHTLKKTDLYRARPQDIHIKEGFNIRDLTDATALAHIAAIETTIIASIEAATALGKKLEKLPFQAIEVDVGDDGLLWVVEGHCRTTAIKNAIAKGYEIEWVDIVRASPDPALQVARMLQSSQGLNLKPLETAAGYLQLKENFQWNNEQISNHVGRSEEQIKLLLILAEANEDVRAYVKSGVIQAYPAIDLIKKHGDEAGAVIAAELEKAKAAGKQSITKSAIQGRALPKKIVKGVLDTVNSLSSRLGSDTLKKLASLEAATPEQLEGQTVIVDAADWVNVLGQWAHASIPQWLAEKNSIVMTFVTHNGQGFHFCYESGVAV